MITLPKVSIVLINYNGYRDTIQCLNSLREITYTNYEVIVVDNGSSDESVKVINDHIRSGEILIESEINGGFSAGNNIGIKYALEHGADYCLLLNNDTLVERDFLNKLVEAFQKNPECGLCIGKILYEGDRNLVWYAGGSLNPKTAKTTHWHYREKDEETDLSEKEITFATGCCMCIPRNVLLTVGQMEEDYFMYVEDVEYCIKIMKAGYKLVYVPSSVIYHKVSASSGKSSAFTQYYSIRNKYILIKRNFKGINKITAYCYTNLQFLFRCISRKYSFKVYVNALAAFWGKEVGKSARI